MVPRARLPFVKPPAFLIALSHPFALDGGTRVTKAQHGWSPERTGASLNDWGVYSPTNSSTNDWGVAHFPQHKRKSDASVAKASLVTLIAELQARAAPAGFAPAGAGAGGFQAQRETAARRAHRMWVVRLWCFRGASESERDTRAQAPAGDAALRISLGIMKRTSSLLTSSSDTSSAPRCLKNSTRR